MNLIIDFFERAGVPDLERINSNMHGLVRQAKSAAEVLLDRTGALGDLHHIDISLSAGLTWDLLISQTLKVCLCCRALARASLADQGSICRLTI